jgi:hypothetical protein
MNNEGASGTAVDQDLNVGIRFLKISRLQPFRMIRA